MRVGFLFWPFVPDLVRHLAETAERLGYDMIGIADTPGNAMDPWVAATLAAQESEDARIALCVSNLASRHPAVSAAAIASLDLVLDCAGLALLTWVAVAADFSHTATFAVLFMIVIVLVSTTGNSAAGIGLADSSPPSA